jgi:transcriptional regulator with XRE-family HTH domain
MRQARERLGISQQRLALLLDLDSSSRLISTWENGRAGISALRLEQIAEALGEPLHYFLGGPSAHPLPAALDPDPWAQPPPTADGVEEAIGELLQVLNKVSVLLNRLGRAGVLVDARLEQLRALGFKPPG